MSDTQVNYLLAIYVICGIGLILFFIVMLLVVLFPSHPTPISKYELDESTTFEMSKQGYTEEEIKEFLDDDYINN
jgi:hypothetical protein